jgi:RsiW-degrading membrane proteinase PrsW (M82 family)
VDRIAVSLIPIFLALAALRFLDSYRLVRFRSVLTTIAVGVLAAVVALGINDIVMMAVGVDRTYFVRYCSPVIEETIKAAYLIYLLKSKKIGFMVDAAIYGAALGAGFSCFENIYYLMTVHDPNLLLWLLRGCGTAMMHCGTTALFGIIARNLLDHHPAQNLRVFYPGMLLGIVIHSGFNHFIISPVLSTVLIMIILPLTMVIVFQQSEESTRKWLRKGLDSDIEVLQLLTSGDLPASRIGGYLQTLRSTFPPQVIGDMIGFLRIFTELSMRAKGILMMREAGIELRHDADVKEKLLELRFLENAIGKSGIRAVSPLLGMSSRSLWQLYLIEK